jgi:hypothetical protein
MKTEDAIISAKIKLVTTATGAPPAAGQLAVPNAFPLRFGWKSKEVYVNNDLIHPTSTHESENWLMLIIFSQMYLQAIKIR